MRVRLLGGLEIEGYDERQLGSRKARTLLKVLALARGGVVSGDVLADVLWPGDDAPARPVEQIGVLVSRLRAVLGAERLPRTDAGWALRADWIDIVELDERVDEAASRLAAGSPSAARAAAQAAMTLVRGELLADEPDPHWADVDRARVARAIARARLVAADAALLSGDMLDAAVVAEGALDHDPYDEAALRTLMRAHAAAGRPASALAAYARVRARLADDLGVDPVKETEELHTAILLGGGVDSPAVLPRTRTSRVVGRTRELAQLDAALADAADGAALSVVIQGEAGIGKTALVAAWMAEHAHETEMFVGRCEELGRGLPLQPLLDALAERVRHDPELPVPPSVAALLGPVARNAATDTTTVADPVVGQAQLFADLLATFEGAAGDRTCVLVVEDVHLATDSTVEWLYYAAKRGARTLVVSTRRFGEPAGHVITLGPLDLPAVVELVGEADAPELFERSGGHPFFLVELAAAGHDALPDNVRAAIGARVDGLGAAASTVRAAAILGGEVDVDLLAEVLDAPVPELLEHIDAGASARLFEERSATLVFRHELVREALAADTTAARRAFVHREAARVLRQRPRHDPLQVAFHAQRGGDVDTATAALVDAAAIAMDRFDVVLAEELLGQAIGLADSVDARLARSRVRIARWDIDGARSDAHAALESGAGAAALEVAAWVEYYGRDYERAYRFGEEAVARSDDVALLASCLAMTGRVAHARGDLPEAERRLVEAVQTAPPTVRGFAQAWLAGLRMHQGQPESTLDLTDRALAEHRWLGHPFALHHSNFFRILALGQLGRVPEALAACDQANELAVASGESGSRFPLSIDNARTWLLRGVGIIEPTVPMSLRLYEETAAHPSMGEMHHAAMLDLLDSALLIRDDDAIVAAIERAAPVEHFQGTNAWHHRQRYGVQRARFALSTGDDERARVLAANVVADGADRGSRRYEALATIVSARAAASMGEVIDHGVVDASLSVLDRCAVLEAWLATAELAADSGVDRWWRDAERRAGALVAAVGDHSESLRSWVGATFSRLGRT